MENAKDKLSRSGSRSDLNESSFPLLEVGEEVDLKGSDEGKVLEEDLGGAGESKDEEKSDVKDASKEGKSKKEKKSKPKKEAKVKSNAPTCSLANRLTAGLNLLDRDDHNVNNHVNIVFEDVLAEPDSNQGFDGTWRLAYLAFSGTKLWVYRVLSAILAVPCGLLWGVTFSLIVLMNVWLISPLLRTFGIVMNIIHKIWTSIVRTFLDPIFQSIGQLLSSINVNMTTVQQETVKGP